MSQYHTFEFHVSRQARDTYAFDQALFGLTGNVVFANFHAARDFAARMNTRRDLVLHPEQTVRASDINAMGLIDEILHFVMAEYRRMRNPQALRAAIAYLQERIPVESLDAALLEFCQQFPPLRVYLEEQTAAEYLQGQTDGLAHREIALEEMVMLWLANLNPAFSPFLELFDDTALEETTAYTPILNALPEFFETQPKFGPENLNLITLLRQPAIKFPNSLTAQLEYILQTWNAVLGSAFLNRILGGLDFIKEEAKITFGVGGIGADGGGSTPVYTFDSLQAEPEAFTPDRDWMPRLVLIAKNAYVWLDQLSKQYQRPITRLDQIPDEELDRLARYGFTGLWLIGLWERSNASQRIKQMCGNPEAVASAYSLYDYIIAHDLGGEDSYQTLRQRAWQRGIRLAADMVPNHVGIYSKWVIEHPDWFISLPYAPFPAYSFNGPNLSEDPRVGIYLEDHYYSRSDAAVVFKRVDHWSGDTRYIYHGNDGTSMPWNDTAQLNYLLPEVREAVIQTILHVARKFSIIRFDAAMTLAKKHYQRLWFPEPGTGGDIPTRAEFGLTKAEFDALFPVEFWREVVDRCAQELPDTLLLAEAFWLMEGYFVRTLGMHRVYNSAFMNMLRDEKNAEYRLVIKNTIEFDPEILKRYVNFMNNPDEKTAAEQFGKGDKYFGIATLMATLPGLPMFGHGQIEGFTEKYGMEYRRAYWDETPDGWLIDRHERQIFPLLHKRYLFAEVQNFWLYDFYTESGSVNEDVYAYSNRHNDERSLVVYHNRYAETSGWIRTSAAQLVKGSGDERYLAQKTIGEGLALSADPNVFTIFRNQTDGLEYIRNNRDLHEQGLALHLGAYQTYVFLDFRQVYDSDGEYAQVAANLAGRGTTSIERARRELVLQPIHTSLKQLINAGQIGWLIQNRYGAPNAQPDLNPILEEVRQKALVFAQAAQNYLNQPQNLTEAMGFAQTLTNEIHSILALGNMATLLGGLPARKQTALLKALSVPTEKEPETWAALLTFGFTRLIGRLTTPPRESVDLLDEWLLDPLFADALHDLKITTPENLLRRNRILLKLAAQPRTDKKIAARALSYDLLQNWLKDSLVQRHLQINRFEGVLWYNREGLQDLLNGYLLTQIHLALANPELTPAQANRQIETVWDVYTAIQKAMPKSEYQIEKLLALLKPSVKSAPTRTKRSTTA